MPAAPNAQSDAHSDASQDARSDASPDTRSDASPDTSPHALSDSPPDAPSPGEPTGRRRVETDALTRGLEVEIVRRPVADSLESAAALLGLDPSDIVKSLVVKRHDGDYLFALIPGDRQISWSKLRSVVGVNKLSLPSPEVALEATGYERGTITPLGSTATLPVYADERMTGRRVALGAGEHGLSLFTDSDPLLASLDATVADISDPVSPRG